MALTREQLLTPVAVAKEEVFIPELNDSVWVKGMTAAERSKFERTFQTPDGKSNKRRTLQVRERLCIASCVDENGAVLFTQDDIDALGRQSGSVIERIVNVAQRLCGMSDQDVEDMAKNSEETGEDS